MLNSRRRTALTLVGNANTGLNTATTFSVIVTEVCLIEQLLSTTKAKNDAMLKIDEVLSSVYKGCANKFLTRRIDLSHILPSVAKFSVNTEQTTRFVLGFSIILPAVER